MQAAAKGHHKLVGNDKNIIVRTFYNFYPFFAYLCAGTEFYYILLVAARFLPTEYEPIPFVPVTLTNLAHYTLFPACFMKNIVNLAQLASGAACIARADMENAKSQGTGKKKN